MISGFEVFKDYLPHQRHTPLQEVVCHNGHFYRLYEVEQTSVYQKIVKSLGFNFLPASDAQSKKIKAIFIQPSYCKQALIQAALNGKNFHTEDWDVLLAFVSTEKFEKIPIPLWKDKNFVMAAVSQNGMALKFVDKDLCQDKDIVIAAVSQNAKALSMAHKSLHQNKDVILAAALKGKLDFSKLDWLQLHEIPEELWQNKTFVLTAVSQNGQILDFASKELCKDKEVVIAAVSQNADALLKVHKSLRTDKDVILAAVFKGDLLFATLNHYELRSCPQELWQDRAFALKAILQDLYFLNFVHEDLLKDKEFMLAAVSKNKDALQFAHKDLLQNREFIVALIVHSPLCIFRVLTGIEKFNLMQTAHQSLLGQLHLLKEDPSRKKELLIYTSSILQNRTKLFLHEEHPLFQEAIEAYSIAIGGENQKNPYSLYSHLQAILKTEPLLEEFADFRKRATLRSYTFADIPHGYIALKDLFDSLEAKGVDEGQVAFLCNGATFEAVKGNVLGESKLIPFLLAQKGEPQDSISITTMYLYTILKKISEQDDTRKEGQLSDRENMLLKFASQVIECSTGQAGAIEQYYIYTINPQAAGSNQNKIEGIVDHAVQMALKKALASEILLQELSGQGEVKQQAHQTLYLQNRYHKQIGLRHTLKFDRHSGVIYDSLINKEPQEALLAIKHYLRVEQEVKAALDSTIKNTKSYDTFIHYFEKELGLKGDYESYIEFDEEMNPIGITPLAVQKLVQKLGYAL
jgi:hypothetical protein